MKREKGFALLQEKEPNVFAFKCRMKWTEHSQCRASFWLLSEEGEQEAAAHPHPSSPPLFFSFICYWSKWGQLLETSVQPWMPQLWLSRRLMHLIYLFGIFETLFSSQSGAPSLIASLYGVRHSTVSTEPAGGNLQEAQETWERTQHFQIPSPSSREGHWRRWERAEKQQRTVRRTDLPSFRH